MSKSSKRGLTLSSRVFLKITCIASLGRWHYYLVAGVPSCCRDRFTMQSTDFYKMKFGVSPGGQIESLTQGNEGWNFPEGDDFSEPKLHLPRRKHLSRSRRRDRNSADQVYFISSTAVGRRATGKKTLRIIKYRFCKSASRSLWVDDTKISKPNLAV